MKEILKAISIGILFLAGFVLLIFTEGCSTGITYRINGYEVSKRQYEIHKEPNQSKEKYLFDDFHQGILV